MEKIKSFGQKLILWRFWVQLSFLVVWLDPLTIRFHNICGPVFHCYACPMALFACPIGVLAHFSALHVIPFVTIGIIVAIGVIFGGFICGWACPFGLMQDLAAKVPTRKFTLPDWTKYSRYLVLIGLVFLVPYLWGADHKLFICSVCPAGALEGAVPNMAKQAAAGEKILWPNMLKISVTVAFIASMFFLVRPWCTLFCPLGTIFGLFNRFSVFFIRFNPSGCTNCNLCDKLCGSSVHPAKNPNSTRCIRCLDCTSCRPEALTLDSIFSSGDEKKAEKEPK